MGALDTIRVVDFGHYVAGPVAGMLLADHGAEVVKIDPPGGPRFDTPANATWNRGKRGLALDLKDADDVRTARNLIERSDIVIENFRPGVMDRLGLGEAELRAANRGLIYVAMPGFGPEDVRAAVPAWEGVVLAATDCFRPAVEYREMVQQLHRRPSARNGAPAFTAEPMASMFAALLSAVGVAAALNIRDETGRGQRVEVPLFDAMIQASGIYGMAQLPFKPAYGSAMNPWDHQYRCADDRWIHIVCNRPEDAAALAALIERPDLVERGLTQRRLPSTDAHHELILILNQVFRGASAADWEERLIGAGLPGAMCRSTEEWLVHPQATGGGHVVDVEDHALGRTKQPAPIVDLTRTEPAITGPAPRPDEHREAILEEMPSWDLPENLGTTPISPVEGPLSGFKVLDLGVSVAGPTCGRTLAELGADVIKVDDPSRGGVLYHHDLNRGKRSLLLDFDTDDGYDVLWDLIEAADIVIENFEPGVVHDLGIDYESVREDKPGIIYASLSAYGTGGPLGEIPGHEETVEAITGMQNRYGGHAEPSVWPFAVVNDYGTGFAAAYGVLLAVLDRNFSGKGQQVTAAMVRTSGLLQSMFLLDHDGKEWTEPAGRLTLGFSPIQRLYRCDDGWIYLGAATPEQLEPILGEIDDELEVNLIEWCEQRSAADAVEHLVKHGMGANELAWLNETMMEPSVVRRGLSVVRDHGPIGLLRTTGPGRWLSRSMIDVGHPAPSPGADAAAILAEINRGADLDRLVATNIIDLPSS